MLISFTGTYSGINLPLSKGLPSANGGGGGGVETQPDILPLYPHSKALGGGGGGKSGRSYFK